MRRNLTSPVDYSGNVSATCFFFINFSHMLLPAGDFGKFLFLDKSRRPCLKAPCTSRGDSPQKEEEIHTIDIFLLVHDDGFSVIFCCLEGVPGMTGVFLSWHCQQHCFSSRITKWSTPYCTSRGLCQCDITASNLDKRHSSRLSSAPSIPSVQKDSERMWRAHGLGSVSKTFFTS